jgi:hypothetical protein
MAYEVIRSFAPPGGVHFLTNIMIHPTPTPYASVLCWTLRKIAPHPELSSVRPE